MSDWTDGYTAALRDVAKLAHSRGVVTEPLDALLRDLTQDALVIDHEQSNRLQRRRLAAAREAVLLNGLPLFAAAETDA
jgi:hypothetical protein